MPIHHDRRRRKDLETPGRPSVAGQATLDVGGEGPAGLVGRVLREDHVGRGRGQLPAGVGVAGLDDDGMDLGAAGDVEPPGDVDQLAPMLEGAGVAPGQEAAGLPVGHDVAGAPGLPQLPGRLDHLPGPVVAPGVVQVAVPPEVGAGEGVARRDHVPRRPSPRQVVEGGQLAGQLVGLVERRVQRSGQSDPLGHRRQGGEDHEAVGAADDVEVVDPAPLLAQPQTLGQEEEIEFGPFRGPGQMGKGREFDVAAGLGGTPHGGVVDAREVRGQMDLLQWLAHVGAVLPAQAVAA